MPYAHVRGIDLYFEECGSGPALIVAHGALGSVATTPLSGLRPAEIAAGGFRVVSYDARGHGRSGYSPQREDYRLEGRAADLLGLMDALGIPEASIVGSSMGASTALMLAVIEPRRVTGLVLRSPSPFTDDIGAARWTLTGLALSYQYLGVAITSRLGAIGARRGGDARIRRVLAGQRRQAIVPALRGVLSEALYPDRLADVQAPTLILSHPGDPLHPVRSAELLRERLPRAKLLIAKSRSHWEEHAGLLTDLVLRFVSGGMVDGERLTTACSLFA